MTAVAAAPKGRTPMNPVLARELRIRLRGRRSWIVLTVYLLLLAAIVFLAYTAEANRGSDNIFSGVSPTQFASVGRAIFEWIILFMLLLVLFLVPGFTSGAIAGERERQTLVPLQVTLMKPWQIVVGKLTASFAFLALLVVAAAPFLGVAFLIGGVTTGAVFRGVGVVLFVGLVVAAVTTCCSALFRRVQVATVVAYAVVILLLVGTLVAWGAARVVDSSRGTDRADPPNWILAPNPLFLTADLVADDDASRDITSPFRGLLEFTRFDGDDIDFVGIEGEVFAGRGGGFVDGGQFFDDNGQVVEFDEFGNPIIAGGGDDDGFPFWAKAAILLYVVAVLAGVLAVRRLRTPASSER
jgi:ABC-type transport system involved in multi-copper enzyme maturation permease subunit